MLVLISIPRLTPHVRARLWLDFFGKPRGPVGWVGARVMPLVSRRLNEVVAAALGLRSDDDLLDVGCGSGVFLEHVAPQVRSVAGLDASEIQVGMARERLGDRITGGTAEVVLGDAEALPWDDGRFDAVASLNCLKFVADPDRALAEMHRVLRAGGRVALLVDPEVAEARSGRIDAYGQRQWSADDVVLMMEKAGFDEVSIRRLPSSSYRLRLVRAVKPA